MLVPLGQVSLRIPGRDGDVVLMLYICLGSLIGWLGGCILLLLLLVLFIPYPLATIFSYHIPPSSCSSSSFSFGSKQAGKQASKHVKGADPS